MSKSKKELKELRNKLERLKTFIEVELEAPNNSSTNKYEEGYDIGFTEAFKDILAKLNVIQ